MIDKPVVTLKFPLGTKPVVVGGWWIGNGDYLVQTEESHWRRDEEGNIYATYTEKDLEFFRACNLFNLVADSTQSKVRIMRDGKNH